jgi:hypothetical protein
VVIQSAVWRISSGLQECEALKLETNEVYVWTIQRTLADLRGANGKRLIRWFVDEAATQG